MLVEPTVRLGSSLLVYEQWMDRIPTIYQRYVLGLPGETVPDIENDPHYLADFKRYRNLMPLAQEARKPVFALTAADGAFGGHQQAAQRAFDDFRTLTRRIMSAVSVVDPDLR